MSLPKSLIFTLVYMLCGPAASSWCSAQDSEFKPMFNGTDLSGWVLTNTPPETWSFEEGMLICSGKPIGEMRTEKMYQNFIMELEWRHMVPRGNAGIFVWADDITSRGVPFHRGIEVQVLENAYGDNDSHTTHGDIFPIHGATMTPINGKRGMRAFPTEKRSKPSPQWNHYRIECVNGEISLAVNGKVVTRGKHCIPRKGYICIESEGGVVHYRNVQIRELPDSDITADFVAISDRGYRSIYSGLNLDGWRSTDDNESWKSNDWVLSHDAESDESSSLRSTEPFDHAKFVVDVRLKESDSRAVIQLGSQMRVDLADPEVAAHLEQTGKWNRIEASTRSGQDWIEINGKRAPIGVGAKNASGGVVLNATGPVDFANLYVATGNSEE